MSAVCNMNYSPPIVISYDYQVVHNVNIRAYGMTPGIDINGHTGVVVYAVKILHGQGPGIRVTGADTLISSVNIKGVSPVTSGSNIECYGAYGMTVNNARLTNGNKGIYLLQCDGATMTGIEGHDQHDINGADSYGDMVQWNQSNDGGLDNFSNFDAPSNLAGGEIVNAYQSSDISVSNGLIDGVYGVHSCGTQSDEGTSHMYVWNVDVVHSMNCGFAVYGAGGDDAAFWNVRVRDSVPSSMQGWPWAGVGFVGPCIPGDEPSCYAAKTNVSFNVGFYYNLFYSHNIVFNTAGMVAPYFAHENFTPMAPFVANVCP